jgi:hypothetical protein
MTIGEKINSTLEMADDLIWKEVHVKKADYHIGVYVNDQTGYQLFDQVREPLLDQFAEDLVDQFAEDLDDV